MNKRWSTMNRDMRAAEKIMEEYAAKKNADSLGLFEIVVNEKEKKMNFRVSAWVVILAKHFKSVYGETRGDVVTRKVISRCITQDEVVH